MSLIWFMLARKQRPPSPPLHPRHRTRRQLPFRWFLERNHYPHRRPHRTRPERIHRVDGNQLINGFIRNHHQSTFIRDQDHHSKRVPFRFARPARLTLFVAAQHDCRPVLTVLHCESLYDPIGSAGAPQWLQQAFKNYTMDSSFRRWCSVR